MGSLYSTLYEGQGFFWPGFKTAPVSLGTGAAPVLKRPCQRFEAQHSLLARDRQWLSEFGFLSFFIFGFLKRGSVFHAKHGRRGFTGGGAFWDFWYVHFNGLVVRGLFGIFGMYTLMD
jgi:hypothetical protein